VKEISRRTLLKGMAVAGAVAAIGGKLINSPTIALSAGEDTTVKEDKWIYTACWMCRECCGLRAHRVDGVIIKVEGDPNCGHNEGKICGRAHAIMYKLYNPYRVKAPMKRTNPEKGRNIDPGWQEITWEEAYSTVAEKMKAVRANNPNEFMYTYGWGGAYSSGWMPLHTAFGSINRQSAYGGIVCGAAMHTAAYQMIGASTAMPGADKYSKYMIRSTELSVNKGSVRDVRIFNKAREEGMKFIVVDPRCSIEASKADEWVPIRPGTDKLMQLAMMHVIFYELPKEYGREVYDEEFIKRRTNGVYLIIQDGRPDDGEYVRTAETYRDSTRNNNMMGKPYVWDLKEGKAKLWDDPTVDKNWKDLALEGNFTVNGIKCVPAFQLFKENTKKYTPEMAESITTVPASTMRRLAKGIADHANVGGTIVIQGLNGESTEMPYRPVGTSWRGVRMNDTWDPMISYQLYGLFGALSVPGGICGPSGDLTPSAIDGVCAAKGTARYRFKWPPDAYMMDTWYPISYKTVPTAYEAMTNPKKFELGYRTKVMMVHGGNALMGGGAVDDMIESFKTVDFIFSIGYHFDEATEMADVVFPDPGYSGWLRKSRGGPWMHQPLLDKDIYDTCQPEDVYIELADRVGFLKEFNTIINTNLRLTGEFALDVNKRYTFYEITDRDLRCRWGKDIEWFRKNGILDVPEDERLEFEFYRWPWGKTRHPLYVEFQLWAGRQHKRDCASVGQPDTEKKFNPYMYKDYVALPFWEEPDHLGIAAPEYDLYACNWKGPLMSMGQTMDNALLREFMNDWDEYSMFAWMHEDTAKKKGLKDGELVWVEASTPTSRKVKAEVKTSQGCHPEAVCIGGEFGQWSPHFSPVGREVGPHYNALCGWDAECIDPISGGFSTIAKVKVYKV